jgi:hypothetical protein
LNGHSTKYKNSLDQKNGHKKWNEDGGEQWQRSVLLHSSLEIPLLFNRLKLGNPSPFQHQRHMFHQTWAVFVNYVKKLNIQTLNIACEAKTKVRT